MTSIPMTKKLRNPGTHIEKKPGMKKMTDRTD